MPSTMQAVVTTGDGKVQLTRVPVPIPSSTQILVKVEACAQNHTDWKTILLHKTKGSIVGCDFAGTVVQLGSSVPAGLRYVGERIAGMVRGNVNGPKGAFAEYLVTDPALVFTLPDDLPFETGVQLGVSCFGACLSLYQTLHLPTPLRPITEPTDILIWSGSSSTGQYAVQFASLAGMRVISTSSPQNFDLVRRLGAAEVFDYADNRTMKGIFAATGGNLQIAVDCISEGMTPCQVSNCLSKEGGTIANLLPYQSRKKGVRTELVVLYSFWGEEVEIPMKCEANPENYKNAVFYSSMMTELLSKKLLKFGAVKIFPNGLASVDDGIAYMQSGKVHAEKVVYRLSDTPVLRSA